MPSPTSTNKHLQPLETAKYTITQSLDIINTTLDHLAKTVQQHQQQRPEMDGNQHFQHQHPLIPRPSFVTPQPHFTINTMNMDRSASPATSRDTAENDRSPPPNNAQSPGDNNAGGSPDSPGKGRSLSNSKRAEQNRRAQRAFRERRDV